MTTSPQNQEEQAQPTPSDVKQSVSPDKEKAKRKIEDKKKVKKQVAKMSSRKWSFFGLRSTSNGLEEAAKTFELTMLKMRLDAESDILEEYELSPEELGEMLSD